MLGSKLIPNAVTLSAIAWLITISCGPAMADQVVVRNFATWEGGDDNLNEAEQEFGGAHDPGIVTRNSDLEMGHERVSGYHEENEPDTPMRIALRYESINIPAGATITGAHIQFMADDEPDKTTWTPYLDVELGIGTFAPLEASFSIYGYLNPTTPANAPPLPNTSGIALSTKYTLTNLTGGRCATNPSSCTNGAGPQGGIGSEITNVTDPVHWIDVPTWSTGDADHDGTPEPELGEYSHIGGTAGPDQRTPDLKSIVQHIVDLPGWAPGNAMTFFIDPMVEVAGTVVGVDDDTFFRGSRVAVSMQCGNPAANRCLEVPNPTPPVLTIDFTIGPTALGGDYNEDGKVDSADYTVWRKHINQTVTLPGEDPNASTAGLVDQEDYDFWVANFGTTNAGSGQSQQVPEPGCCVLFVSIVAASLVACRRSVH
jgi:hypothetical protein